MFKPVGSIFWDFYYNPDFNTELGENSKIADMFDDMKTSQAIMKIFYMYQYNLIDNDRLQQFSDETRERVKTMIENYG
ncbi:MAG: hypothetical protein GF353_28150 [Candidatus Lokiarchaeota archaeon]|nr:hypothetical protein [Candidatus Lokiarchaeota archaeon]